MGFQKNRRPDLHPAKDRVFGITQSTAPSTTLDPNGIYALLTTSTIGPVVYKLRTPKAGDQLRMGVAAIAATSGIFNISASTDGTVVFGSTNDMVSLSTAGAGVSAVAVSSSQWLVTGSHGATFSTST